MPALRRAKRLERDDRPPSSAVDRRLLPEARDRKPATERRASHRSFVRQETARTLSRVRAAALRTGAGAPARTREATRPGRAAPAPSRDGRIRGSRLLERQTRAHPAPGNRTTG